MNEYDKKSLGLKSSPDALDYLRQLVESDPDFLDLLLASLQRANEAAQENMNVQLREVLIWPTNFEAYLEYLDGFSRWVPHQSCNPGWADPDTGFSQEVYDHLCHFYYLIDQPVGSEGEIRVQDIDWFSQWLVEFAALWGSFLNTPDSFNDQVLQTFIELSPEYRVKDSMLDGKPNKSGGWQSFNDFFSRTLNPGLRPIASPEDNAVITMPADCTYRMHYPISATSTIPQIVIKKTHEFAEIADLLKGSKYADAFANGTFVHYFLGPYSYHRFHTPVAGVLEECYAVQGSTFLEVNINDKGQFDAPDNSSTDPDGDDNSGEGYEFNQARGVITIDTRNSPYGDMGIVAAIPVGMCQVSSVNMTATPGPVEKGDEFGYFLFGGSDIILLFQEGKIPSINTCNTYRYYGTDISTCPNSPK